MLAGQELEILVEQALKHDVIKKLDQKDPENIPVQLISGLNELISKRTHQGELLESLYDRCFPYWLRQIRNTIRKHRQSRIGYDSEVTFEAILRLLASSLKQKKESSASNPNVDRLIADRGAHSPVEYLCDIF